MLTRWLTFTAFLAAAANQQRAAIGQGGVSVAPTCKVKGHPEEELTLHCGDGKNAGVVRYWHTPFGELQTPGFYSALDPVFLQHDRSLVITNSSSLHSGLYYCLLQHSRGTTLWPYELHVGRDHQNIRESSSCARIRFRRDVVPGRGKQASPSEEEFAGAVAASVLLTFVLGFSAGALSRTHVLRCFGAITMRLRSPRQQTDTVARGSEVTMTTLPPMYQASGVGHAWDDDSVNSASMDTTISSTASSPPAKPQRSFKHKREAQQETAAYLEGCDNLKEEEQSMEEGGAGRSVEEKNKVHEMGVDEAETVKRELRCSHLLEEDGGKQSKMEEDKCSEDGEEKEEGESREEKRECEQESDKEVSEQENKSKEDGEEGREHEEEAAGNKETEGEKQGDKEDRWREGKDGEKKERDEDICGDSELSTETESEGNETQEDTVNQAIMERAEAAPSSPTRRRRVIRLYQYDEDGQRYAHLPDSTCDDLVPRPRQRSVSLTRLNTIMASASAGPLDLRGTATGTGTGTGKEEKEERPHFHMDI